MPRPFYIIGHNPNCIDEALKYLRDGANALEPDVHLDRNEGRFRVCHSTPTDGDPYLETYLDKLSHALRSASGDGEPPNSAPLDLRLIAFDLKPDYDYDINRLYGIIRDHFSNAHSDVLIATTISDPDKADFLKGLRGGQRPNELVGIDENAQPEDVAKLFEGANLKFTFAAGIDLFDFAPLNALVGPRSFLDRIHRATALAEQNEAMALVYAWTVNNDDDIRAYLELEPTIDALLTDNPGRVREIILTEFAHKYSL
jgi:hypothetical protein